MKRTTASAGALALLLAAGAWLCAGGCLNPRPEELPSSAPAASETPGGVDFGGQPGAAAEDPQAPGDGFENNEPVVPPAPEGMPPSGSSGGNTASDAGAPDAAPEPDPEAVEAPE